MNDEDDTRRARDGGTMSGHGESGRADDATRDGREPRGGGGADEHAEGSSPKWGIAAVAVIALGVLGYFAVGWLSGDPEPREAGPVGRLVESATVASGGALFVSQTGFVTPVERLTVSSEVSGRVARVADEFRTGRRVAKDTVLVELVPARFEADVAAARARLDGARARRDTARSNAERLQSLDDEGFAADARVEEVETSFASAEADVALADSELRLALIALDDATLRAPYDAVVGSRDVSLGQILSPGVGIGTLIRADQVEIAIGLLPRQRTLLESDASLVGRPVDVFPVTGPRRRLATGRVAAIDPVLDPVARTLGLLVRIDDPFAGGDGAADAVRVGELVEVVVPVIGDERPVLEVPAAALKGADRLWRITDEDTLEGLYPTIVRRGDGRVQILADALSEGDRVLLTDLASATDGQRVRMESASGSGADSESEAGSGDGSGDGASADE